MAKKASKTNQTPDTVETVVTENNDTILTDTDYDDENGDEKVKNDTFMMKKCEIIGKNVRYQRKKRKFNIDNLAECIELSASYVGLLERGDRCPSLKSLLKLCDLFNVTPNDLLLEKAERQDGLVGVAESTEKNVYDAVISLLHGLNEDELEYLATQLKALRKMTRKNEPENATAVSYSK